MDFILSSTNQLYIIFSSKDEHLEGRKGFRLNVKPWQTPVRVKKLGPLKIIAKNTS